MSSAKLHRSPALTGHLRQVRQCAIQWEKTKRQQQKIGQDTIVCPLPDLTNHLENKTHFTLEYPRGQI